MMNSLPSQNSQAFRVLEGLLRGDKISPITAVVDYNCFAVNARCSELRKLGWPVSVIDVPHPNQTKFPDTFLPCYYFDNHFLRWMNANKEKEPSDYPSQSGRGKFVSDGAN